MANQPIDEADRETRLNEILLAYVESAQEGRPLDRRELLSQYPEFATELRDFFGLRDQFNRLSTPLREASLLGVALPSHSSRSILRQVMANAEVPRILDQLHLAGPPESPLVQSTLGQIGEFQLIREVGRGGMGVVYEAHQTSLNRRVALKVLPFAAALDPKQLQRFQIEAQAAAQLHHTNIVPVFGVGTDRGVHYYAMQFIEGQSLSALIDELCRSSRVTISPSTDRLACNEAAVREDSSSTPFASDAASTAAAMLSTHHSGKRFAYFHRVAELGMKTALALDYAHRAGVVHRDIKPANLLVDGRGELWITDFGLAMLQSGTSLTMTGETLGTLRYMSPEQAWARRGEIDHRTDIYSLGVTLYELLTLRPAVNGQDRQELLKQLAFEDPPLPRKIDNTIPVELETIVLKACAKTPAERYATAEELAADLQRFLEDKPIRAKRPTMRERATKWSRRHRSVVISAAALMLITMAGSILSTILIAREQAETEAALEQMRLKALEVNDQRALAELSFKQAREAVAEFEKISEEELANKPELRQLRKRLLSTALHYYQEFIDQRQGDVRAQEELAASYSRLGKILGELGAKNDALAMFLHSREAQSRLVRANPLNPQFLEGLASIQENLFALQSCGQLSLLTQKSVADELKLTGDQRARIERAVADLERDRRNRFGEFRRLSEREQFGGLERIASENEKVVADILDPQQARRLKQIDRQMQGPFAFGNAEIAATLQLSEDQKSGIQEIHREIMSWPGSARRTREDRKLGKTFEEVRRENVAKCVGVLTAEQRARWEELIGKPFQGEIRYGPPPGFHDHGKGMDGELHGK
jgi:serine/threonine protein kinase